MKYDFDGDGVIGPGDLRIMLLLWKHLPKYLTDCDHNNDGIVDVDDLGQSFTEIYSQ